MANRNFPNGRAIYIPHVKPVLIDCNFIVDSTNGNGLGIRSLKGPMVQNVYMHTSASPAPGSPNPASGIIVVQLMDNYNRYLGGFSGQVMALGGSTATIVAGSPYVITALGTTTAAQWLAAGVDAGQLNNPNAPGLPNLGLAFIAASSETIPGAPSVNPPVASGIDHIEVIGDTNQAIGPDPTKNQGFGAQIILQCQFEGAATAPANGSAIGLAFYLNDSSVLVAGE